MCVTYIMDVQNHIHHHQQQQQDLDSHDRDSRTLCRRWTVFTLAIVVTAVVVIVMSLTVVAINNLKTDAEITDSVKQSAKTLIITECVIAILVQLLGLTGSYRQHYGFTLTYGLIMTMISGLALVSAIRYGLSGDWILTVLFIVTAVIAMTYARDLRLRRLLALNSRTTIVYSSGDGTGSGGGNGISNANVVYQGQPVYLYPGASGGGHQSINVNTLPSHTNVKWSTPGGQVAYSPNLPNYYAPAPPPYIQSNGAEK
ncbi:uncharacterized protein LOC128953188 [Oppia nitens]|uniref:uncharacterized protein LOC128953188 n=1 Tax=Oppia nitens TaxID=1686743 RepID=UPI0023DBFD91|nr:uncharacterized protein LOC128953188 [Oppia nitens]